MKTRLIEVLRFLVMGAALALIGAAAARASAIGPAQGTAAAPPLPGVSAEETDVAAPSDVCTYPLPLPLPNDMCVYYGDLHSHTGYSDGQGTPQEAYQMARANGLDFLATTDHAEQLNGSEWYTTLLQAQAATVEGEFVALRGFEWTSEYGHINVLATDSVVRSSDPYYNELHEFYAWLSAPLQINGVAQFNHPFYPDEPFDNWRYDSGADLHVYLVETHNSYVSCVDQYDVALAAGWHVGAASNSDTHQANWGERRGRTGIVAPALTYRHLLDGLRARRTFSTEDENLALVAQADGYWMGSVLRNGPVHFDVYAFDPDPDDPIATLELYRNGELFQSTAVNTNTFVWSFSVPVLPQPGAWWYVKAIQEDGEAAYTSPIWTQQPQPHDVLIRDNMWDVGDVPALSPAWHSPDIWVRNQADGETWHENPVAGQTNFVYVRVQNVGTDVLDEVDVYLYWTRPLLGFAWPGDWRSINSTPLRVRRLTPGDVAIVSVPWNVPDSIGDAGHVSLLARLVSAQDQIYYEGRPRWDNNVAWKNVHLVQVNDGSPTTAIMPVEPPFFFHLSNPFPAEKAANVYISSPDFPPQGYLALHLEPELFDRWMAANGGGLVKGATVATDTRTISVAFPVDAAVYGLPLTGGEISTASLSLGVQPTATVAVHVSEQIDGEEVGGSLYTTSSTNAPRKIALEASAGSVATGRSVRLSAAVVGDGFVPVADETEVRFSTTLGNLSTETVRTVNGAATVTLEAGTTPGTAIVQAGASGLVTATTLIPIYRPCWARLNDDPTTFSTLQAAVDASTHPTDVIKVAGHCAVTNTRGGMTQVVYLSKTLTIRGGYTVTNWTTFDPRANPTVLDAGGQGRVLVIAGVVSPTVEGLHVTGGNADGLGGGPAGEDAGGGVYVVSATATLKSSHVVNNVAEVGGGLYLSSSDAELVNLVVADNQATGRGGGLYVGGGAPRLLHTTIARNVGGEGSGIHVTNAGSSYSRVSLTNTILMSHTVGITVTAGNTAALESTLWGSGAWSNDADWGGDGLILAGWEGTVVVITGTRNYWGEPGFVAPEMGDYHVGVNSMALDLGVDAGVRDDVDGDPRPTGHGYDIGADELRVGLVIAQRAGFDALETGVRLTYTVRITNVGDVDLHATITDTLPAHIRPGETTEGTPIVPGGPITWSAVITARGGAWSQQVVVTAEMGYVGPLTNVVRVTTAEGATGAHTHTLTLAPALEVVKRAVPDPVEAGSPLVYTIRVTNTGNLDLHTVVTDTLPHHIAPGWTADGKPLSPGGAIVWSPVTVVPGSVWTQQVVVTPEVGYSGGLTNVVRIATLEGVTLVYTTTSTAVTVYSLYLPVVMRNHSPPEHCAPRLVAEVETGPQPRHVALDVAGGRAFVTHAQGITVIDLSRNTVITATRFPTLAHGIAYDPDRDRIWIARRNADRMVVLDGASYAPVADLPTGDGPHAVAYNPANGRVYVTNYWSWTVSVYDAEALAHVTDLSGFAEPAHLAVNAITNKIYVANHRPNQGVIVIDGATHERRQVVAGLLDAYGVAVDASRNLVYATAIAQGRISVIDGATNEPLGHVDLHHDDGKPVWLRVIAVNPDVGAEGHLWVVISSRDGDNERDQLLLIPNGWPTLGTPVPLEVARYPQDGIALDADRDRIWLTSVESGLVSVVQDGEPVCSIPLSTTVYRLRRFQ